MKLISADRKRRLASKARRLGWVAMVPIAGAIGLLAAPAPSSMYFPEQRTCPIGGEKFEFMGLMSISTWGALPDGMPIGSGYFPTDLPQCPRNGLVMYRDFNADELKKLKVVIESREYRKLRDKGSPKHYLAFQLAKALGDEDAPWLLLSATWQAKNENPKDARVNAYNEEFASLVQALPISATSFNSIALRARAANALREIGHFSEADNLRRSIVIAPDAGSGESDADENRKGWAEFLVLLAGPIARQDRSRSPIDMMSERSAAFRCLSEELATTGMQGSSEPLSPFERDYCASPKLTDAIAEVRRNIRQSSEDVKEYDGVVGNAYNPGTTNDLEAAEKAMNAAMNEARAEEVARVEAAARNVMEAADRAAKAQ
ncbi:hypothetical protein [Sphingobium fluviale]|uniref:Uncharacterized protein n=1 Tax=Sphingobium fluviale TaxID=2506423 RepID=A0A4Q1KIN4_9SPHN|nr:hypothetical protein [Sphingobium fluviale]RXR29160.1 hypothetical protein EQG66_06600 [Sphingobium fluviale]